MIFVHSNGGRLCNKLWSYAATIAYAIKFNQKIYILDFDEYLHLFNNLNSYKNVYFLKNRAQRRLCKKIITIAKTFHILKDYKINSKIKGIGIVNGWELRFEEEIIQMYFNDIFRIFSPGKRTIEKINTVFQHNRNIKTIIGVHIRRRDYKDHFDGKYYFTDNIYQNFMQSIELQLKNKTNKDVVFLICSDEPINLSGFSRFNCIQIPDADQIDDLYALSQCDFIFGVPSTFTIWASFYGKVPLYIVEEKNTEPLLKDFKIVTAVDRYKETSEAKYYYHKQR